MPPQRSALSGFLADTWWFGLSRRFSEERFRALAALRAEQGFSAIQLVVGVPPEIGPLNENARSKVGFPWTLDGAFNRRYLCHARDRIEFLNRLGLMVIVYGAWGHQIEWLGRQGMINWWLEIVETLDDLDTVYCLCGESNLWLGRAHRLLPNKSTDELFTRKAASWRLPSWLRQFGRAVIVGLRKRREQAQREGRRRAWSAVLEKLSRKTERPIIVHPVADETGYEAVSNPALLTANTAQTGHDERARDRLWKLPLSARKSDSSQRGYINLEPWYEGIRDRFWAADQLFAYWASMLAGAQSHCYGAHGIWNAGDGEFLAHWGTQTFAQAAALDTPRLLGLSHRQLMGRRFRGNPFYQAARGRLRSIGQRSGERAIQFFPDVALADHVPAGEIWLPLQGVYAEAPPPEGQVVVFCD
jgi:hypothetical protein